MDFWVKKQGDKAYKEAMRVGKWMSGKKAKKADAEVSWENAKSFARSFGKYLKSGRPKSFEDQKKLAFLDALDPKEMQWLSKTAHAASKEEMHIFLKTVMYFIHVIDNLELGEENLVLVLKKMARDNSSLGEFYDYLIQYSDEKVAGRELRMGSVVSLLRKESELEDEYREWFCEEFCIPPEEVWSEYPNFFSTKTPKEFKSMRKKANLVALNNILSSVYGVYVGHAILGKINNYIQSGELTKLSFESRERAARVASLLFEFGLEDLSQNSNRITLGLKETVYEARKKIDIGSGAISSAYVLEDYLKYFKVHGLPSSDVEEITKLSQAGRQDEALEKTCKSMLQNTKKEYLILGEKKYRFGHEGEKMVAEFKRRVGGDGEASLLLLYDMIRVGDYPAALDRLKNICGAIDEVREGYPHLF